MAIKVKAIVGSISSTSVNAKIVNFMQKRYAGKLDITPVYINDLEMFSPDIEDTPPENVKKFKDDVKDSDAVLIATPEYNFSVPGALKNAIDWLSRGGDFTLKDKPTFIIGASPGALGSVRSQVHLREMLQNPALSPIVLPNNDVFIGGAFDKMDDNGDITDQGTIEFLDTVVNNFEDFYNKVITIVEKG